MQPSVLDDVFLSLFFNIVMVVETTGTYCKLQPSNLADFYFFFFLVEMWI